MDFSFVQQSLQPKDGAPPSTGRPAAGPTSTSQPAAGSGSRPLVAIPSFREVQRAEQQRQTTQNIFRPSGLSIAARQASITAAGSSAQQQQAHHQQLSEVPQPQQQQQQNQQQQQQQQERQQQPPAHLPPQPMPGPRNNAPLMPAGPRLVMPQHIQGAAAPRAAPWQAQQQAQPQQLPQQQAPVPQQAVALLATNAIVVSRRQQGNPLLNSIRNVRWQYGDIVPDYLLGANACALFLSLRYHLLHPDYIIHRIKQVLRAYRLTVVLVHVDAEDVVKPLADITRVAMLNDCTMVCAWSSEECARYLETFKAYENKPAGTIQERVDTDYLGRLTAVLTSVRSVNKNDAATLGRRFGTFADMLRGQEAEFSACPGLGPTKVRRLHDTFNEPFRKAVGTSAVPSQTTQPARAGGSQAAPASFTPAGSSQPDGITAATQQQVPRLGAGTQHDASQGESQQALGTQAHMDLDLDDDIEEVDSDADLMV